MNTEKTIKVVGSKNGEAAVIELLRQKCSEVGYSNSRINVIPGSEYRYPIYAIERTYEGKRFGIMPIRYTAISITRYNHTLSIGDITGFNISILSEGHEDLAAAIAKGMTNVLKCDVQVQDVRPELLHSLQANGTKA